MVRYAQFCDLPCDPTPQQSIQFQEQYKNIKGMLSIKSLTAKIEPLFEQNLGETAKIYSLAVNGTHADFLLTKNRLKYKMQTESINELTNLSEYLAYKIQQFKQLETALKASLEEEFKNFVLSIQATLNNIYQQYRQTLKTQFQVLKQETEKQTKIINIELKRLERELDIQSLKRRKLKEDEMAQIAGISRQEMFGYSILFRIVSNQTLEGLQNEEKSEEREVSIDSSKIKRINCNQLWYLMELIKKKKDKLNNPDAKVSEIFQSDDKVPQSQDIKPQTFIERKQVLNSFEEQTFKTETHIIQELSAKIGKKAKNLNDAMLNSSSVNDSNSSDVTILLTDFIKEKQMKSLLKSVEAKIQAEFVKFNERFNFGHFVENKGMKKKKRPQIEKKEQEIQKVEEKVERKENFSVEKKYYQVYGSILEEIQPKQKRQVPENIQPKRQLSPSPAIEQKKQQIPFYSYEQVNRNDNKNPYKQQNIQKQREQPQSPRFRQEDQPIKRNFSNDKTVIDKLSQFRQNRMNSIEDKPLVSYPQAYNKDEFSLIQYENQSIEQRKKQAEQQYDEYIRRMKIQQNFTSQKQRRERQEELSRQQIKRIQEEQQREKYKAYQEKLAQEEELKRFKEKKQREKQRERQQRQKERQRQERQRIREREQRQIQRQRQNQREKQRIWEKQREWERERDKQRQRQRERIRQKQRQRQRERQRERQKQRELQKLRQFTKQQKMSQRNSMKKQEPVYKPDFFKKDLESSRVLQEWKQSRRKLQEDSLYGELKYDSRGNLIREKQERVNDPFGDVLDIPGVDMEEQMRLMQEFESKKHKAPGPEENVMMKRFKDELDQPFYPTGAYEIEREYEKPSQGNMRQEFGFGDIYREKEDDGFDFEDYRKEQEADQSILQFAMQESLNDTTMKKKKNPIEYLKPVGKFIADTFTNVVIPNIAPRISKKLEETFDNTLIDFEEFLSGMGKKKESFSLQQNFKYEVDEVEEFQFFQAQEKIERLVFPASMRDSKGLLTIKDINRQAEQLNTTKEEFSIFVRVLQPVLLTFKPRDRQKNRPMTKLIVGDSTGIGILYMNYYFEVKAGCCLRLDNCRLHKYCGSFEINHHRNITISGNVREGSAIPRVDNDLMLSLIRRVEAGKYVYEVRPFFNHPLSHCISQFARNKITIGEMLLKKPIIVSVCDVTRSTRKCVIGDYTGKILADLSNLKQSISLELNDTLLIRNARMQINRGDILLLADEATRIVKADRVLKFSHDMRYIQDKILKGNVF